MNTTQFTKFSSTIRSLTPSELNGDSFLNGKLRIASEGQIEVCYAPLEYVNPQARIAIVGITPGRTQWLNAMRECQKQLKAGADEQTALIATKRVAAFSGSMRPNLVAMLDHVGVHRWLGLSSCDALFSAAASMVQTTSALRNPVFANGENYNGTPNMLTHPLLQQQLIEGFGKDASTLPNAVFVPLGEKVEQALYFLADRGVIQNTRILGGLPHPSGANAERIAYFLGKKQRSMLSSKTSPEKIDRARTKLQNQITALS